MTDKPTEADELKTKLEAASREAASYRSQRNAALRKASAYETMLKAHSISLEVVTDEALEAMTIRDGRVDSPFKYTAPKPEASDTKETRTAQRVGTEKPAGLTRDDISGMSEDEINRRWDEIAPVLQQGVPS